MTNRKEIINEMLSDIYANPLAYEEYLQAITYAIKTRFIVNNERNCLAENAIRFLLNPHTFDKFDVPTMLPAVRHQFPENADWKARSQVELKCLRIFYDKAKEYFKTDGNRDWAYSQGSIRWWQKVCEYMEKEN